MDRWITTWKVAALHQRRVSKDETFMYWATEIWGLVDYCSMILSVKNLPESSSDHSNWVHLVQEIDCIDDVRIDKTKDSKATSRLAIRNCYPWNRGAMREDGINPEVKTIQWELGPQWGLPDGNWNNKGKGCLVGTRKKCNREQRR